MIGNHLPATAIKDEEPVTPIKDKEPIIISEDEKHQKRTLELLSYPNVKNAVRNCMQEL